MAIVMDMVWDGVTPEHPDGSIPAPNQELGRHHLPDVA